MTTKRRRQPHTPLIYSGEFGEHISDSAANAIALAARHDRPVRLRFNSARFTVTKRLSVRHVVRQWGHIIASRLQRDRQSIHVRNAKARRQAEINERQQQIDALMSRFPDDRINIIGWLAEWIPLQDDVGVNRHSRTVMDKLKNIGFRSNEHVGDPALLSGAAPKTMRIEYVAGQVISLIEHLDAVHPMLGEWAKEIAEA